MNEEALFHTAEAMAAGERAAFLEQACASDAACAGALNRFCTHWTIPAASCMQPIAGPGCDARSQSAPAARRASGKPGLCCPSAG